MPESLWSSGTTRDSGWDKELSLGLESLQLIIPLPTGAQSLVLPLSSGNSISHSGCWESGWLLGRPHFLLGRWSGPGTTYHHIPQFKGYGLNWHLGICLGHSVLDFLWEMGPASLSSPVTVHLCIGYRSCHRQDAPVGKCFSQPQLLKSLIFLPQWVKSAKLNPKGLNSISFPPPFDLFISYFTSSDNFLLPFPEQTTLPVALGHCQSFSQTLTSSFGHPS